MQLLKILMYWQDGYKHLFIPYILTRYKNRSCWWRYTELYYTVTFRFNDSMGTRKIKFCYGTT